MPRLTPSGKRGREQGEAPFETAKRALRQAPTHAAVEPDDTFHPRERDGADDAMRGRAGSFAVLTPPPMTTQSRPCVAVKTFARQSQSGAQRRLKYLLPASRRGTVARALDFGDGDGDDAPSAFFTAADEKAEVTIVVRRAADARVWEALARIEQLAPLLAALGDEVRLTRLRVETGTFELEGAPPPGATPGATFRTDDDGLLEELRRRQWAPRWHALDAARLPLAPRAPASPAAPPPAPPRSLSRTEPMDALPPPQPPSDPPRGDDADDDSGGVWEVLEDSDEASEALIAEACSDEQHEPSARNCSATSMPAPVDFSAAPARALDGVVVRPTPVRAALTGPLEGSEGHAREHVAHPPAPPRPPPAADALAAGGQLARGDRLARGLAGADSALANLFAMAAAVDAQFEERDRALHADCEMELCADYADARLRALNAAFSEEDSRIGAFPPCGPILAPFCAHLLVEGGARGGLAVGYILHSGKSSSDDILPELHHVYIRPSHRRRGHAMRMLRWWIDRYAQHSFTFAVNDPNADMRRVLRRANGVQQMHAHSNRIGGCAASHYYLADSRLKLATAEL